MSARSCMHCATPVGGASDFCCTGCEAAAQLLQGMGLEDWYGRREGPGPRVERGPVPLSGVPVEVVDGLAEVRLRLDGLRCASCVSLAEAVLAACPAVSEAHVSFASGHTRIRYDADAVDLSQVLEPVQRLGYRPAPLTTPRRADRGFLLRFGVSAFAAANVMLATAALYIGWFEAMEPHHERLFRWVALALSTPVAIWCAAPFHRGAWEGLKRLQLHMHLPISIAVVGMYAHGVVTTFRGGETWLDSLVMLVSLLLFGRLLEARGRSTVAEAATALAAEIPPRARVLRDGEILDVDARAVVPGEVLELAAGERLVADGVVLGGEGQMDLSLVTGESTPRPVEAGHAVRAGALLRSGGVRVEARRVGEDTLLGSTSRALAEAMDERPGEGAHELATLFTGATLGAAAMAWIGWGSIEPAVAVLVAACPCALVLARPLCLAAGLGVSARAGLLVKNGDVLEALGSVDRVWLDKTGTLTHGAPRVLEADDEVLRLASGLERSSVHPVARALVAETRARRIPLAEAERVLEHPGRGVHGSVDGHSVHIEGLEDGEVGVWIDRRLHRIRLQDRLREESRVAIDALRSMGVAVGILSGDAEGPARRVAEQLGITDVVCSATPLHKLDRVAHPGVCFVGDGLNDVAALHAAPVGLAMAEGAAASVLAADGVLLHDGVLPLVAGIRAGRRATAASIRARRRALVYNVLAVTAALAGWLDPLVAAIAMPLSSALVVATAASVNRTP